MKLMAHQKEAIKKLSKFKVGALFMDMGTGKTVTYMSLALSKVGQGKATHIVVLCPVATKMQLKKEIKKHFNIDSVLIKTGQKKGLVNIIGIESLSSSIGAINALAALQKNAVIILDESHLIKNRKALRTQRVLENTRQSAYRYISTGTPITNGIEDLYTQCLFLDRRILGYKNWVEFERAHLRYAVINGKVVDKVASRFNVEPLAEQVGMYAYQIKKEDCLDLPPKSYSQLIIEPSADQKQLYELIKNDILSQIQSFDKCDGAIYKLFTFLQMVSSGVNPAGYDDFYIQNPKVDKLEELIKNELPNKKVVIWCKYIKEMSQIISRVGGVALNGTMSIEERQNSIDSFNNQENILVSTIQTGGTGLNLSKAEYAIYVSNSFDYMQRIQSEDRLHRIGTMHKNVHYIDLSLNIGIDKKIKRSLNKKENAFTNFINKIRQLRHNNHIERIKMELINL